MEAFDCYLVELDGKPLEKRRLMYAMVKAITVKSAVVEACEIFMDEHDVQFRDGDTAVVEVRADSLGGARRFEVSASVHTSFDVNEE